MFLTTRKIIFNVLNILKPIWHTSPAYVIINILYTFENIPRRLISVLVVKYIVDAAVAGVGFQRIVLMAFVFIAIQLAMILLKHCFTELYKRPREIEVRAKVKLELFNKIKNLDLDSYDNKSFYDKYTLAFSASENTAFDAFESILKLLSSIISTVTLGVLIIHLTPILIIIPLVGSAISLSSNFFRNRYAINHERAKVVSERKMSYVNEVYSLRQYATDVRTSSLPTLFDAFYKTAFYEKVALARKYGKKYALSEIVFDVPLMLSDMLMWLYIARGILRGILTAGDFMALSNAAWSLSQQLRNIFNILPHFQRLNFQIENILFITNMEPTIKSEENYPTSNLRNYTISVRNISFAYNESNAGNASNIINNVSFEVGEKQKIAIVGHNGAGKSTLLKLLLRLYDPLQGSVNLAGNNLKAYNLSDLRSLFSVVFQDYQHYSFSIAENVLMRQVENDEDTGLVLNALKQVGMLEKVQSLPNGIDTPITKRFDEAGELFSGGELQRLAVARALVKNTPIILMDEPSSALDPIAEREIADLLLQVFADKTVIIISHRLTLTKACDQILVMDSGELVEQGSHNDLLHLGGKYFEMWTAQAELYS